MFFSSGTVNNAMQVRLAGRRNFFSWCHSSLIAVVLSAIMSLELTAWAAGSTKPIEYRVVNDIVYNDSSSEVSERHRLNLVLPQASTPVPLLMWIPGGAWAVGDREQEMPLARLIAQEGIAVAVIDHRMSPGGWLVADRNQGSATHPDHIEDVAAAFAWLKKNASRYGFDGDNIFVGGFSSGAHLSALLAMDEQYLRDVGFSVADIKGVIPVAGAYDMKKYYKSHINGLGKAKADQHVIGVFGHEDNLAAASPTNYMEGAVVPMLVISEAETYDYTKIFERQVSEFEMTDLIQFRHFLDETHRSLFFQLSHNTGNYAPRNEITHYILSRTSKE